MYNMYTGIDRSNKLNLALRVYYDPNNLKYKTLYCSDTYKISPICVFPIEILGRKIISPDGFIKYSVPESFYNEIYSVLNNT